MSSDIAISVNNLSKVYKLYNRNRDRLKEAMNPFKRKYHKDFYALNDVSFEIKKGETVGIIGKNGSGKSTLLKILTGVLTPTSGTKQVNGRISSLLELGAGFNPELTGLENIYFNGTLMGYSRKQMKDRVLKIIEFADIGDYIDQPVRTYSSGMFVRLAFATAINVDPDVLIIDEALSVGDARFQQKCYRKINDFKENGKTIILVTHDTAAVTNFCDRAIWILDGVLNYDGEPTDVVNKYISKMSYNLDTRGSILNKKDNNDSNEGTYKWQDVSCLSDFGEKGAQINKVAFYEHNTKKPVSLLSGGETVVFAMNIKANEDLKEPIYGFLLKDEYGNSLIGVNTYIYDVKVPSLKKGEDLIVEFIFKVPLLKDGTYTISASIAAGTQTMHNQHHWIHDVIALKVIGPDLRHKIGCYLVIDDVKCNIKNIVNGDIVQ
jgi:ABC-type polysaccharide/polyol phosphate transport system ATPase subunit